MKGGKPEYPEKNSRNRDENQQQTQPTYDAESGNRTRATLVRGLRGKQMLNHCAIPALLLSCSKDHYVLFQYIKFISHANFQRITSLMSTPSANVAYKTYLEQGTLQNYTP